MFTETEISEMFRMGTLNGKRIERSKFKIASNKNEQVKSVSVIVNGSEYTIKQISPYKENREESKKYEKCEKGIPDIIVYYEIEPIRGENE